MNILENRYSAPVGFFEINDLDVHSEKQKLLYRLKTTYPLTQNKNYFFITFWDASNYGYEDLPIFDTLITPLRNDVAYVFASGETNAFVELKLRRKKIKTNNFLYINNQDSLKTAIYQERKMKEKFNFLLSFPLTIVLDKRGNTLYFDTLGFYGRYNKDSVANCLRFFGGIDSVLKNLK